MGSDHCVSPTPRRRHDPISSQQVIGTWWCSLAQQRRVRDDVRCTRALAAANVDLTKLSRKLDEKTTLNEDRAIDGVVRRESLPTSPRPRVPFAAGSAMQAAIHSVQRAVRQCGVQLDDALSAALFSEHSHCCTPAHVVCAAAAVAVKSEEEGEDEEAEAAKKQPSAAHTARGGKVGAVDIDAAAAAALAALSRDCGGVNAELMPTVFHAVCVLMHRTLDVACLAAGAQCVSAVLHGGGAVADLGGWKVGGSTAAQSAERLLAPKLLFVLQSARDVELLTSWLGVLVDLLLACPDEFAARIGPSAVVALTAVALDPAVPGSAPAVRALTVRGFGVAAGRAFELFSHRLFPLSLRSERHLRCRPLST